MEIFHNVKQIYEIGKVQFMAGYLDGLGRRKKKPIIREEIARLQALVQTELDEYNKYIGTKCDYVCFHKEKNFKNGIIIGNFKFNIQYHSVMCAVSHDGIVSECDLTCCIPHV